MPAFIRTKSDETRWKRAKEAANKSHSESEGKVYWKIVNSIYQKMTKMDFMQDLIEKLSKVGEEDEDENYFQDYGPAEDEDLESQGFHEVDPYQEDSDEASAWLREHDPKRAEEAEAPEQEKAVEQKEAPKASRSGYSEWQPRNYSEEEGKAIKSFVDQGYSPREAERLAGAHKGPTNFQDALTHTVKPSQASPKMMSELKEMARHWLDRADKHAKLNADPEKNPQKYASGKLMQAHEEASRDYNSAYNNFLESEGVKGLKGLERHKAIQAWKQDYKSKHPEYLQNVSNVSSAQKHFKEAGETYGKSLNERMRHILSGGVTDPSETVSAEEGAQHVGGVKDEDKGYMANIIKDPSAAFAERSKLLPQATQTRGPKTKLGEVQHEIKQEQAPGKAKQFHPEAARQFIVRRASPEQLDRFKRTSSARSTLGVGKKPEGDK